MNAKLRPSGFEGVGDIPWGAHFCMFYQTKDDLLDTLIPYFKAGLESHEFCLYVASEPVIAQEAERALREAIPNFERYLAEGQIEIVSHFDWYLSGGHFDPLRVRQAWIDKLNRGLAQGNARGGKMLGRKRAEEKLHRHAISNRLNLRSEGRLRRNKLH